MRRCRRLIAFICVLFLSITTLFARDKFALVLSGGGARGIAHIPVLEELERRGIVPDYIIGTSMGALVGGFYSAGWTAEEIEDLVLNSDILGKILVINNKTGELSFVSPDSISQDNIMVMQFGSSGIGSANGVIDDQSINGFLRENLIKVLDIDDFDDLPIPFRAIGTDITNGEAIIFDSGSLYTALRASMSLPVIFPPVKIDDDTWVMDGGLVDNLPVDVAKKLGADIVLAVDVNDALNSNRKINPASIETLTGVISAFSLSLNMTNSTSQYKNADWVLVPDVSDFSTLDFDKASDILEAGKRSVYENVDIFDILEKRLKGNKGKSYELYKDMDPVLIEGIEYEGIKGFDKQLNDFIGKPFDEKIGSEFESLLLKIKRYNRLKSLSYEFKDGIIVLKATYFNSMEGAFSLGSTGEFGVEYNGVDSPYFIIDPNLSVAFQYHLSPKAVISAALIYHDTFTLQTRFSVPVFKNAYFYAGADFDYLDLSLLSMPRRNGHIIRNDYGASANTGLFWDIASGLVTEVSFGFDYIHLSEISNPIDNSMLHPCSDHGYAYFSTSLNYNTLNSKNALDNGINTKVVFDIGSEFVFNEGGFSPVLGYSFKASSEMVFGLDAGVFRGIVELEADTIRRNPYLNSAYAITKTGIPTSDFLYGIIGLRGKFPKTPIFFDVAPFVEFFHKREATADDYWKIDRSLAPFSTINDWTLGAKIGLGLSTEIGTIYANFYFGASDKFRCSFMLGVR